MFTKRTDDGCVFQLELMNSTKTQVDRAVGRQIELVRPFLTTPIRLDLNHIPILWHKTRKSL